MEKFKFILAENFKRYYEAIVIKTKRVFAPNTYPIAKYK